MAAKDRDDRTSKLGRVGRHEDCGHKMGGGVSLLRPKRGPQAILYVCFCHDDCPVGGKREAPQDVWLERCTCPASDLRKEIYTTVRAANHGRTTAQVVLRWHLQHGHIAIPKSARPERMMENISFDFELSPSGMVSIGALDRGPDGRVGPDPDTYEGV